MENVAAITFDVGGTLIEPWPSVGHVYAAVAARHGVRAEPEELTHRFVDAWNRKENFSYSQDDWAGLVDATFAGLTTTLPSQSFFDELYYDFGTPKPWRIFDDVLPTIAALRERGTRLAVISNWDDRLCPLLESLELANEFEVILVSAVVRFVFVPVNNSIRLHRHSQCPKPLHLSLSIPPPGLRASLEIGTILPDPPHVSPSNTRHSLQCLLQE